MEKNMICIICPRGCSLTLTDESGKISATGNACPKGEKYAIDEYTRPLRTVTSIVRVNNRTDCMVSVKTAAPIPKDNIFDAMKLIRNAGIEAPVKIGDTVISDVFGTDIIATKNID